MQENIVLLTFEETSKAYQALSEIKRAALEGRVRLVNAAVVEREAGGALRVRDGFSDGAASDAPLVGTLLGSLLGVLGGPLGILLLGSTGAVLGSLASADVVGNRLSLLDQITRTLPPGSTAVFANVSESAVEVLDGIAKSLGAVVLRRPTDAVVAEVEAAVEAQDAATREARKVLHAKQRAEWRDKFDHWKDEMGDRLTTLGDRIKASFEGKKP
ncbi:MAG: DUF1269 domain-containing protein [Proteobacteria bacterium]|nr:DUF1269 domain-containing protein [Pseudomonadota bacterium]